MPSGPFGEALTLREIAGTATLVVLFVVLICAGLGWLISPSESEKADKEARKALWEAYVPGSTVARICADGTYVRRAKSGELFIAFSFGPSIQRVSSSVEQICDR